MRIIKKAVIRHKNGLHARVAAMVVQKSYELKKKYDVSLFLHCQEREKVTASSLMLIVSLRIKEGDEVWVSGEGEKSETAVGEMVSFLESDFPMADFRTITQVDHLLHENTFTAEQVFHCMANGLVVTDENDIITIFNPAAERIMSIAAVEAVGKPACDVIPGSRMHIVNKTMIPELGCRQLIGNSIIVTNRSPIIVNGEAKGVVAIFEDISAMEKTAGELREVKQLKEKLQLVLESVHDGICVLDEEGFITYVNPAYLRIVGEEREALLNHSIELISPQGARHKVLVTGEQVLGSISTKQNGVTIVANVNPIVVDGEIEGAVSIVKDVSELQGLLEKLNQVSAKAEYLEQELWRIRRPSRAFSRFIGRSGKALDALAIAAKAAEGLSTVLIRGESGTGKELVAEGIHSSSSRTSGPFIRVNCAAIPATLLESELFGHEKGAFTGAIKKKLGKFELANKGTIFLDEIGEMEKNMQVKLLRVIQEKELERVGGEETFKVDVRIIAATNRNLEEMVANGEFREDLYYRLNVIPVFLPSLRERKEDIPMLVEHFINKVNGELYKEIKGIKQEALDILLQYRWPGNVRELENVIERAVTLTDGRYIESRDLPLYVRETGSPQVVPIDGREVSDTILSWEEYEKHIIQKALKKYGSYNAAAKVLGLTHKTVAAKAQKYGIEKNVFWEKKI